MRKAYASQESVATTLTAAERAAPFQISDVDTEPLPACTRRAVLSDDAGVVALVEVDRRRGTVQTIDAPGGEVTA